jgi:hypothetical protein
MQLRIGAVKSASSLEFDELQFRSDRRRTNGAAVARRAVCRSWRMAGATQEGGQTGRYTKNAGPVVADPAQVFRLD